MILGKDDAVRMREAATIIIDTNKELKERLDALELLQDLVEPIDNANNMARMDLWTGLLSLLTPSKTFDPLQDGILKLVAMAARNNPEAAIYLMKEKQAHCHLLDRLAIPNTKNESDHTIPSPSETSTPSTLSTFQRWTVSALSALVAVADIPPLLHQWMENESLAAFQYHGLIDMPVSISSSLCEEEGKEQVIRADRLWILYSNYSWAQGNIPACLQQNHSMLVLFKQFHRDHCDGQECPLITLHQS